MFSIPWGDIALCASIALPGLGNWFAAASANADRKHHTALAQITGLAAQEAASITRALTTLPAGASPAVVEMDLINASVDVIVTAARPAIDAIGGNTEAVRKMIQSEFDKLLIGRASPSTAPPPPFASGTLTPALAPA
jgi:hypothetical protein